MVSVGKGLVLDGKLPNPTNLTFHAIFGATFFIGALTQREWYHKALVVGGIAGFILYVVLLFARLQ